MNVTMVETAEITTIAKTIHYLAASISTWVSTVSKSVTRFNNNL